MNSLSWFIYLADILGNVSGILGVLGFFGTILGIIGIVSGRFVVWDKHYKDADTNERLDKSRTTIGNYGIRLFFAGIIFGFLAAIIPSQKSMYMIAGSEIGETVITHPDTVEVYHEVRDIILEKLREYNTKEVKIETK